MIEYAFKHPDKLGEALLEHIEMVTISLVISLIVAFILTILAMYSKTVSNMLVHIFSVIYTIPSLAVFAVMIPVTGLGTETAVIVLVLYNQYLLLRNFIAGLNHVDPSIIEAATGMGMRTIQVFYQVRLPLSKKAIFTGIRLAVVSTIGMATIAALINAGGLGDILLDGLRTLNVDKMVWGSVLSAGLAIGVNALFIQIEKRL